MSQISNANSDAPKEAPPADIFARLMQHVLQGATLDTVLNSVYDNFKPFLPFNRIGCALIDEVGERIVARWCRSDRPVILGEKYSAPIKGSSLQFVLEMKRPRILNNLEEYLKSHPTSASTRLIVNEGFRSSFTFPLIAEGHGIGFLFFSSVEIDAYSEEHLELLGEIAGLLSLSILVGAQRDQSSNSHCGYIEMLNIFLRSVNPSSERVIQLVGDVARMLNPKYVRHYETAAMLTEVIDVISTSDEKEHKSISHIVSRIAELETVSTILDLCERPCFVLPSQYGSLRDEPLALGANLIRTVRQFNKLELFHSSIRRAIGQLRREPEAFAPFVVDELERIDRCRPARFGRSSNSA